MTGVSAASFGRRNGIRRIPHEIPLDLQPHLKVYVLHMTNKMGLETWAQAVAQASPELTPVEQEIAVETYRLLARGEPVSLRSIADAAGGSVDQVEESLGSWPLIFWDDQNRVVGFWGLSIDRLEPTHAMQVDGTTLYAWCAWDTLFVTEILGTEARVSSVDPNDGSVVELTITPDGVIGLEPDDAVVSLLLPDGEFGADTIARFCHRIHFFSSARSAEAWLESRPAVFAISVDEAFELGRLTNRLRLGSAHRGDEGDSRS